jgi:hypothetical protein
MIGLRMTNLADKLIEQAKRHPYFHLEGYMERYWLTPFSPDNSQNTRIHHILSSDKDRIFHDHSWESTSIILKGGYWEIMPGDQGQDPSFDDINYISIWRAPGDVVSRKALTRHRIELPEGKTSWSMFIMGKYENKWGFYTPEGKVYWREYLNEEERKSEDE